MMDEFKAAVEISRKWDGNEVANEITQKFKSKALNPRFILLFTTIHYQSEFEKILSGIKNEYPELSPSRSFIKPIAILIELFL